MKKVTVLASCMILSAPMHAKSFIDHIIHVQRHKYNQIQLTM